MLNEDQIIKKLSDQVKIFKDHMMRKEYLQAVLCADQASMVVMCRRRSQSGAFWST